MALKRLQKELKDFDKPEEDYYTAAPIDSSDLFKWEASIQGPVVLLLK